MRERNLYEETKIPTLAKTKQNPTTKRSDKTLDDTVSTLNHSKDKAHVDELGQRRLLEGFDPWEMRGRDSRESSPKVISKPHQLNLWLTRI